MIAWQWLFVAFFGGGLFSLVTLMVYLILTKKV